MQIPSYLTSKEIEIISKKILKDYDANNPGLIFKDKIKITNSDALLIQSAVSRLREKRGEEIIGYKVGCTGPGTTAQFDMDGPIRGTLFGDEVMKSGSFLNQKSFCHLAVEGEMAIKINPDSELAKNLVHGFAFSFILSFEDVVVFHIF